jgi:regulatory protein
MIYAHFGRMFWLMTIFVPQIQSKSPMRSSSEQVLSYEEVRDRLMRWCSVQDRAQMDARQKMLKWGLSEEQCEALIDELIQMKFLDDSRFAESYVNGHVRLKKWGKYKLLNGLKQHGISDQDFQPVLDAIDQAEYQANLREILQKKLRLKPTSTKEQLLRFALQRGYEHDLVMKELELI